MKTIHSFPIKDEKKINDFFKSHPFEPGTLNFNNEDATITLILDHDARADRERNALEDNLHAWKMKINEAKVTEMYWTEQSIKEAKNPNKEIQKTISDNLNYAKSTIEMNQSNAHAIEGLIEAIKNGDARS